MSHWSMDASSYFQCIFHMLECLCRAKHKVELDLCDKKMPISSMILDFSKGWKKTSTSSLESITWTYGDTEWVNVLLRCSTLIDAQQTWKNWDNGSNLYIVSMKTMLGLVMPLSDAIHMLIEIMHIYNYLSIVIWFLTLIFEAEIN